MTIDTSGLKRFAAGLQSLPKAIGRRIADRAAPVITEFANDSFGASTDPYGAPWAPAQDGSEVDLVDSGALRANIRYVAIGTRLRVALGVKYAKYQIGKRPVFPREGLLPKKYADALQSIAQEEIEASIFGGSK